MFIDNNPIPKSSFLSMDKDLGIIINTILKNKRLKKLLYYTTKDCMEKPDLDDDQTLELIEKNIKITPKIEIDKEVYNYVVVLQDGFTPSENPEFRDNLIIFLIMCHNSQWKLKDFALRPYKIAGEIDQSLNNKRLTGIGTLDFVGASQETFNDEYSGLCLIYMACHGEEDKRWPSTKEEEASILDNFKEMLE